MGDGAGFVPRGQLPREDLQRSPLPPRPLVTPRPCLTSCYLSPVLLSRILHEVRTLPSSCPVHITYRVSSLSHPCFPVLHIYSNPTERNPSTHIKPHIQTVLIHYFNSTNNENSSVPLPCLPSCIQSVPTSSSAPHLLSDSLPLSHLV